LPETDVIILHAAPITWGALSGPSRSVPALVAAQNRIEGVQAALVVTSARPGAAPELPFPVFGREVRLTTKRGPGLFCPHKTNQVPLSLNLLPPFDRPDLVVFHCPYNYVHAVIAEKLRAAGIPYVICPRGGMTRNAQRYRRWKKVLGNLLFFNQLVCGAAAINCLTEGEAAASRAWKRPVFVVGNGIELPDAASLATPGGSPDRRLVFIGRLHVHYKNLDTLLAACHVVRGELASARAGVELYGPDCQGSRRVLGRRIAALGLTDLVRLPGPVLDEAKSRVLAGADAFLHPSRSEGHPMAVLEALAHGVPCLLTPVTNVADEVAAAGAGWRVKPTTEGIAAGLREVLRAESDELREAGAAARRLAEEKYRWDNVAVESLNAYRKWAA
jgi:glycosyltransferase involved in cell wall biosynthesis